ncbi:hypothetical protein C8F04DRAFT_1182633 [Mycena alexandri]|uniref:F-box domain-containing protein n=1 Tax=Mycena alexandri TaxID=1745969 RepID=A0AAD6X4H1_9AGAR|nr:hypothetical protein C8F04DRAFT_1182633 [Mycena alexandri]
MKRFPPELVDTVIDFCYDDPAALASCGLVCRDWLPASRYHIFSAVLLTPQNAPAFLELISHSTTIAPLVCDVELRFTAGSSMPHLQLAPILMRLPHTTHLTLCPKRDEVVRPLCTSSLAHALLTLPLVHLKFDFRSRFESLEQIIDCVCLCAQLESLELGGSWMRTGDFSAPPLMSRKLHTLTLTCDLDNFLTWFMALEDEMPVIQHLFLYHIVQREIDTVAKYLRTAGPSLQSLTLAFRDHDAPDRLAAQTDLSQNTSLRTLTLEGASPGIFSGLLAFLSQLTLCEYSTLSIALTIRHSNHPLAIRPLRTFHWPTLDEALSTTPFLKRLSLTVVEPLTRAPLLDAMADIMEQLPLTRARGILVR